MSTLESHRLETPHESYYPIDELRHAIEHAAHLLPSQRPITSFVHHNTLHAFEDQRFHDAVKRAWQIYRCQPYLSEAQFHQLVEEGQIPLLDLWAVLLDDLGDDADHLVGMFGTRFHLRQAMLQYRIGTSTPVELRWLVAESDALRRFRPDLPTGTRQQLIAETKRWVLRDLYQSSGEAESADPALKKLVSDLLVRFGEQKIENWSEATWESFCLNLLWRLCHQGIHRLSSLETPPPSPVLRHRDYLLEQTGQDIDILVNEVLIPFCGTYTDQGFADWELPRQQQGFWKSFSLLYDRSPRSLPWWMKDAPKLLLQDQAAGFSPLQSIENSLKVLGVAPEDQEEFITKTLLALSGWTGMIWQLESNKALARRPIPEGSLTEYLAIRLILERSAITQIVRSSIQKPDSISTLYHHWQASHQRRTTISDDQRAFHVFNLVQIVGWSPESLAHQSREQWKTLIREIELFGTIERRRIYHAALERRYCRETLDAVSQHSTWSPPADFRPTFQVICCLDDREESIRRHLEEVAPQCETFGTAGFFAVAMNYQGAGDSAFRPLCPVILTPRHFVKEEVCFSAESLHLQRAHLRKRLGSASHQWNSSSRTMMGGIITGLLGSVASVPLVMSVLFPRVSAKIRKRFGRMIEPPQATHLQLHRTASEPSPEPEGIGFTVPEMVGIVERVLREIGLVKTFSRLICVLGHGSSSFNNPHESAYNCGACSGGRGGPNARAFSQMANDPRVRVQLATRGINIPEETWFIGGYHNTCDDSVTWYDLDHLPSSHRSDFKAASKALDIARRRNAHERCRRFETAPLTLTEEEALQHVEQRSEDLSQARPEYNHATNALCIIGRRSRTRGLFLDRRAFLGSYDPTVDDENHSLLLQALGAAFPVCAGISLEYYFSTVDPNGYGCGSKLPHNITSLVGVMEGAASDLRPGLSQQMVEIHQPMRILFLIETTPEIMLDVMNRNATIQRLVKNEWVQLATLDPNSSTIHQFVNGRFEVYHPGDTPLPTVQKSVDWYRGWRGPLGFAAIQSATETGGVQ